MFRLPKLPYEYSALEPHISARVMELHHSKHHQTYVDKLNAAIASAPELKDKTIEDLLRGLENLTGTIKTAVRNHGGGYYNHSLFWQTLSPSGGGEPSGALGAAIAAKHGSFEVFQTAFSDKAAAIFGSGWAWLLPDMSIVTTANQDTPLSTGNAPLLGLDVWEHAYYLDYQQKRPDYITAWWNVIDWSAVVQRYDDHSQL